MVRGTMQENHKMSKSNFFMQFSAMNFTKPQKTGWLKSAALLFVLVKVAAVLVVAIIVLELFCHFFVCVFKVQEI